jgi:hypothetical protein
MCWFLQNVLISGELTMHRLPIFLIVSALAFAGVPILAQQQAPPTTPAPTATPKPTTEGSIPDAKLGAPCVILKRMGPADEITSHLYSFGIRGKQFQYVEGNLPQGISFHGRLTDHDARKILDKAGKIQILEPKYTPADLDAARRQCSGLPPVATEAGKDALKQEEKATTNGTASIPASETPTKGVSNGVATISVSSNPDGADIYADDSFIGSAPATLKLSVGKHTIKVSMAGFKDWSREITAQAGAEAHLTAGLEKQN